jgi:hypothetical protein
MIYLCQTNHNKLYYIVDTGRDIRTLGYSTVSEAIAQYSTHLHIKPTNPDKYNIPPQRQILHSGSNIEGVAELMDNYPELFI